MATLDLKPLTDETIQQMGFNNHDLWLVKIHAELYGPFETESLKHYASENEEQFDDAEATRLDENQYKAFWTHPIFQRRKVQVADVDTHEGPFWLMEFGLKIGPLSFREVDKKIEMGLLGMTDHISIDDGETWNKIYKFEGFDRRSHDPDELPVAPAEASFQKAKLVLIEKLETPHANTSDEIAAMVHTVQKQSNIIPFKLDELSLNKNKEVVVSNSLKWALPAAMALGLTIVSSGYFMFSEESETLMVSEVSPRVAPVVPKVNRNVPVPRGEIPSVSNRAPASVGYQHPVQPRAIHNQESRYPTTVETHHAPDMDDYGYDQNLERDPRDGPVMEASNITEEHSLIGGREPQSDNSVDDVMNGNVHHEPMVEEVSDF